MERVKDGSHRRRRIVAVLAVVTVVGAALMVVVVNRSDGPAVRVAATGAADPAADATGTPLPTDSTTAPTSAPPAAAPASAGPQSGVATEAPVVRLTSPPTTRPGGSQTAAPSTTVTTGAPGKVVPTATTAPIPTTTTEPARTVPAAHHPLLAFFDFSAANGLRVTDMTTGTSTLIATGVASYSWSPDGTRLAFADTSGQIWTSPVDHPAPVRLTPDGTQNTLPAWSPRGDHIAFLSANRLFVMDTDGGGRHQIADLATDATTPTWSADGTRLAFVENDPNAVYQGHSAWSVWIVNTDGTGLHRLTDNGNYVSWSPDGNEIFYVGGGQLIVEHPDGTDRHPLFAGTVSNTLVAWSADSQTIAVSAHGPDGDGLYRVTIADGTYQRLTPTGEAGGAPTWAPDGNTVAYTGACGTGNPGHVCQVNADGSGIITLIATPSGQPGFAPQP